MMGGLNVSAQFHNRADAEAARQRLIDAGFSAGAIVLKDPSARDEPASDSGATTVVPPLLAVKDAIPRDGVEADAPPMGGIVVSVEADDRDHDRVLQVLHADGRAVQDLTAPRHGTPADEYSVRSPDYDDGLQDGPDIARTTT